MFPNVNTIYDYYINNDKNEWSMWEEKVASSFKLLSDIPFHKIFVPTSDTVRNKFILTTFQKNKIPSLSVGITGTGKTALIQGMIIPELEESVYANMNLVFSAQTSS